MEEDDMDDDSDDDDMVSEEFNQILWAHNYEVQWNDINGRKNKMMIFLLFVLALIQSLVCFLFICELWHFDLISWN